MPRKASSKSPSRRVGGKRRTKRGETPPSIALFLCRCGTNIASVVDLEAVQRHVEGRPGLTVVVADDHLCSEQGLNLVRDTIREHKADRVVVAACSPRLHGELFAQTVEEAGLNRGHLVIANIREQCSWVHWDDPPSATAKAQVMVDAALAMARHTLPLRKIEVPVTRRVLVIGGGVAGITAALGLADAGYQVILVERSGFIGGHMAKWDKLFPTFDCSICILGPLMTRVAEHPKIRLLTLSEVVEVRGAPGDYRVRVRQHPRYVDLEACNGCNKCLEICPVEVASDYNYGLGTRKAIIRPYTSSVPLAPYIDMDNCVGCQSCVGVCEKEAIRFDEEEQYHSFRVGAIIVATGFHPFDPHILGEYGYGRYKDVLTAPELERLLNPSGPSGGRLVKPSTGETPRSVAFIQCVGSRDHRINRPYCSRVCCTYAVKEAVQIKQALPDTEVYIFYVDMRTFGKGFEELYDQAAREHGINFIRGRVSEIWEDPHTNRLKVRAEDTMLAQPLELEVDMVVLSVGIDPAPSNPELANLLNIPLDEHGFFLEKHPKLGPTSTYSVGIFLAGTSQSPKDIADTVAHAGLAAMRAASLLARRRVEVEVTAPLLARPDLCEGCRLCVQACDPGAITFTGPRQVSIDEIACTGCGACVAACPTGALDLPGFTRAQLANAVQAAVQSNPQRPRIVGFLCHWCAYAAADAAGISRIHYPPHLIPIRIPCTGRLDPLIILEAFSQGADGVAIIGCHEQDCHHRTGLTKAKERAQKLREVLAEAGVDPRRLLFGHTSASEGSHLADLITSFTQQVARLGPLGTELQASTQTLSSTNQPNASRIRKR